MSKWFVSVIKGKVSVDSIPEDENPEDFPGFVRLITREEMSDVALLEKIFEYYRNHIPGMIEDA